MPISSAEARRTLLADLNKEQKEAVRCPNRRLLVIAGAGSGKTEVMARRVAWWVAVDGADKKGIIAFTFTEAAAEELKFRIRAWLERMCLPGEDPTLGGMYIGTMHGFCLSALRDLAADEYYVYDVIDDAGRMSLVEQGYNGILALRTFETEARNAGAAAGKFAATDLFLRGYDLLHEYNLFDAALPAGEAPADVALERDWCRQAVLNTTIGNSPLARAFAESAARYYAYLRARRFLDFGTVQTELTRKLARDRAFARRFRERWTRLVVDEVQDINPVQDVLVRQIVGKSGHLTAVGDHRQAIYAFRGGRVDLMGKLHGELSRSADGRTIELPTNYRSTPRIIELANQWSDTIQDSAGMSNPHMTHGRKKRIDSSPAHVALLQFPARADEADWIARTIRSLVPETKKDTGAFHDDRNGMPRGLTFSDIAILVRSSTDIRTYQDALRDRRIPAVVRGGPDLFSQPEVLYFLAAFCLCAGIDTFFGGPQPSSLPSRIQRVLGAAPQPEPVVRAAATAMRARGLVLPQGIEDRLITLAMEIRRHLETDNPPTAAVRRLRCPEAKRWLQRTPRPRRIFPQTIFHWLLNEGAIHAWENDTNRLVAEAARFHVGQLSRLVTRLETSGWTPAESLKWQLISLLQWGSGAARAEEAPLLVSPNAVTITTVHSAKGLEFAAVFLADLNGMRFPSNRARTPPSLPYDADFRRQINPQALADNFNYDNERRLLYVALTRAERYLFITCNGNRISAFFRQVTPMVSQVGGTVTSPQFNVAKQVTLHPAAFSREDRLATSFSDIRYYLECPHDFYLRIVLGFSPTIDQAFGYGRGVHNLLRAIHSDPKRWAQMAADQRELKAEIARMVESGMFYLRYTTGEPLANLRRRASEGVVQYVETYAPELSRLQFEPEREFETVLPGENLLISGAIDVVRLDDPPRVTILDFKSGDSEDEVGSGLTKELMGLQIGVYGLAARHELEYEPEQGVVRYIGERDPAKRELPVELRGERLAEVRKRIITTGRRIRDRRFHEGPSGLIPNRCARCDFCGICGRPEAAKARRAK